MLHNWFSESFSKNSFFFCKIFFYFRIHFCQIKQRTTIALQADFFSDQWAYISCVTIFYYLYCMVQEVYIGSLYDQYAASTILLPKRTILANIPVPAEKGRNWSYSDPNALPISWSAECFPSIGRSLSILKVFAILTKNYVKSTYFFNSKEILLCTLISRNNFQVRHSVEIAATWSHSFLAKISWK